MPPANPTVVMWMLDVLVTDMSSGEARMPPSCHMAAVSVPPLGVPALSPSLGNTDNPSLAIASAIEASPSLALSLSRETFIAGNFPSMILFNGNSFPLVDLNSISVPHMCVTLRHFDERAWSLAVSNHLRGFSLMSLLSSAFDEAFPGVPRATNCWLAPNPHDHSPVDLGPIWSAVEAMEISAAMS